MNQRDVANMTKLIQLANDLLNAGDTGSGITNLDVVEAAIDGAHDVMNGKPPAKLAELVARDEAHKATKEGR